MDNKIKYKNYVTNDIKLIKSNKIIDWDTVSEICMCNKEFFNKIFKTFFEDLLIKQEKIKNSSNLEELYLLMHGIKGTSATFGFNLLSCCCNHYLLEYKKENCDIESLKIEFIEDINKIEKELLENIELNLDNILN